MSVLGAKLLRLNAIKIHGVTVSNTFTFSHHVTVLVKKCLDELRGEFRSIRYNPIISFITSYPTKNWPHSTLAHTQLYSPSSCNKAELR